MLFRPQDHPCSYVTNCPKCHKESVSLPAYPGDYFDCEQCGHSWKMTRQQLAKMCVFDDDETHPVNDILPGLRL